MFDWVQPLIQAVETIIEFLSQFVTTIFDVIDYIGKAVILITSLGPLLPAPITVLLGTWSAIMILYSVKGS